MNVKSVEEDPIVDLFAWHFVGDEGGYRLLGFRTDDQRGRITSGVRIFNPELRRVMTESGRVYRLHGELDPEAAEALIMSAVQRGQVAGGGLTLASVEEVAEACPENPRVGREQTLRERIAETVRQRRAERLRREEEQLYEETDRMIRAVRAERRKRDWRPD